MHSGGVCQRSQTASCIAVLSYLAACSHCCAMTDINTCFVVCHVSALLACVGLAWVNHVVVMQRWWCIWLEGGDLPCGSVNTHNVVPTCWHMCQQRLAVRVRFPVWPLVVTSAPLRLLTSTTAMSHAMCFHRQHAIMWRAGGFDLQRRLPTSDRHRPLRGGLPP